MNRNEHSLPHAAINDNIALNIDVDDDLRKGSLSVRPSGPLNIHQKLLLQQHILAWKYVHNSSCLKNYSSRSGVLLNSHTCRFDFPISHSIFSLAVYRLSTTPDINRFPDWSEALADLIEKRKKKIRFQFLCASAEYSISAIFLHSTHGFADEGFRFAFWARCWLAYCRLVSPPNRLVFRSIIYGFYRGWTLKFHINFLFVDSIIISPLSLSISNSGDGDDGCCCWHAWRSRLIQNFGMFALQSLNFIG